MPPARGNGTRKRQLCCRSMLVRPGATDRLGRINMSSNSSLSSGSTLIALALFLYRRTLNTQLHMMQMGRPTDVRQYLGLDLCRAALENRHVRGASKSTGPRSWVSVSHDYTNDSDLSSIHPVCSCASTRQALVSILKGGYRDGLCAKCQVVMHTGCPTAPTHPGGSIR